MGDIDLKCPACGMIDKDMLDTSRYDSHGEVECLDCMVVTVVKELLLDDSPAPFKEGDDTRAGGPTTKYAPQLYFNPQKEDGDREWTVPPSPQFLDPKKKRVSKAKKSAESKLGEIPKRIAEIESEREQIGIEKGELVGASDDPDTIGRIEELRKLGIDLDDEEGQLKRDKERYLGIVNPERKRRMGRKGTGTAKTGPPKKGSEWMDTHRARDFLRLDPKQEDSGLADNIRELDPDENWIDRIVEIIGMAGLPERTPLDEMGRRMWTPRRERIGIEVFANRSKAGKQGFWFFSDYIKRLGLSDKRIDTILRSGLPLSSRLFPVDGGQQCDGFVTRCFRLMGDGGPEIVVPAWYSNPPPELLHKLALGVRGTATGSVLHFWVPRDMEAEIEVKEGEIEEEKKKAHAWAAEDDEFADQLKELAEEKIRLKRSGEVKGWVRRYPDRLILSHIPLAYYVAQELRCRSSPGFRLACSKILEMISEDLEWCAASVDEMDDWWDSVWGSNFHIHGNRTGSVTELRPKERHG